MLTERSYRVIVSISSVCKNGKKNDTLFSPGIKPPVHTTHTSSYLNTNNDPDSLCECSGVCACAVHASHWVCFSLLFSVFQQPSLMAVCLSVCPEILSPSLLALSPYLSVCHFLIAKNIMCIITIAVKYFNSQFNLTGMVDDICWYMWLHYIMVEPETQTWVRWFEYTDLALLISV